MHLIYKRRKKWRFSPEWRREWRGNEILHQTHPAAAGAAAAADGCAGERDDGIDDRYEQADE